MTFKDRLTKMLEHAGTGRPSTEMMLTVLLAKSELEALASSAQSGEERTAADKLPSLFRLIRKLAEHADTALIYGADVVRTKSTANAPARDAHLELFHQTGDLIIAELVELRRLMKIPY